MGVPDHPVTREEQFLDAIRSGSTSNLPTPVTRTEEYLNAIANNGGGGGSGGGVLKVNFAYDDDSGSFVGDQKASDVFASFVAGETVLFVLYDDEFNSYNYYLVIFASNDQGYHFRFSDPNSGTTVEAMNGDDGYVYFYFE